MGFIMQNALRGIRVIELASVWAMPGAGMYLADQGADVIKVEPAQGDMGRFVAMSPPINGLSRAFWPLNRNKRSIALNLKHPEARPVLDRLVASADVVIHNFRPSAEAGLGIDYPRLREVNPRLIYAAFNAFGRHGAKANARGYDLLVQAAAGISTRRPEADGYPRPISIFAIDMASSVVASYAIALALLERERTGEGQAIHGSLLQTALALQVPQLVSVDEVEESPASTAPGELASFGAYRCADGAYLQVSIANNAEWRNAATALGLDVDDPHFKDANGRTENSAELHRMLAERFATDTADAWERRLLDADAPGTQALSPDQVLDSKAAVENAMKTVMHQPGIGTVNMVDAPFRGAAEAPRQHRPAPDIGQDTDAVLSELGFEVGDITTLKQQGVFG